MLFKNSVHTSERTPHFTITKINWLTLFKLIKLQLKLLVIFKHILSNKKLTVFTHYYIFDSLPLAVNEIHNATSMQEEYLLCFDVLS
jgi:hypothetical protein